MLRRVVRGLLIAILLAVITTFVALEVWYSILLPRELPQAADTTAPQLVREALWLDLCRDSRPRLRPLYPFLLPWFVGTDRGNSCLPAAMAQVHVGHLLSRGVLRREKALKGMLQEMAVGTWVSRHWTVEQALDTYASLVWMGDDHYGIEEGARVLFGKTPSSLSVSETALLISTTRSPRAFSPTCHPGCALEARNRLLDRLRDAGLINESAFREAVSAPLGANGTCVRPGTGKQT